LSPRQVFPQSLISRGWLNFVANGDEWMREFQNILSENDAYFDSLKFSAEQIAELRILYSSMCNFAKCLKNGQSRISLKDYQCLLEKFLQA
jgi:hypothetical protein